MSLVEIILLSVSLCFDTFAVSISSGICLPQISKLKFFRIILVFAILQSSLFFIGWIAGKGFLDYISSVDHWIAFLLLFYVGSKMLYDSLSKRDSEYCADLRNTRILIFSALATSIDAIAAGVSLAIIQLSGTKILITLLIIAFTTATASFVGIKGGRKIGNKIGKRAELTGGLILILIGIKILMEHLNILY